MLSSGVPDRALADSDTILCRIEDAAAALIIDGTPNPAKVRARDYPGGGSLATILPVKWAYRVRLREETKMLSQCDPLFNCHPFHASVGTSILQYHYLVHSMDQYLLGYHHSVRG